MIYYLAFYITTLSLKILEDVQHMLAHFIF